MDKMKNKNPITVIDLGSNTFRLVIYAQAIPPFPILYQKREFLKLGESIKIGKKYDIKIKDLEFTDLPKSNNTKIYCKEMKNISAILKNYLIP